MARRRHELTDAQWARIEHLLPGREGSPGRTAGNNRDFARRGALRAENGHPVARPARTLRPHPALTRWKQHLATVRAASARPASGSRSLSASASRALRKNWPSCSWIPAASGHTRTPRPAAANPAKKRGQQRGQQRGQLRPPLPRTQPGRTDDEDSCRVWQERVARACGKSGR